MHLLSNPRPALPPSQPAAAPPPFSFVRLSFFVSVPPSGRDPQDRPPPTGHCTTFAAKKHTLYLIISLSHYDHRHAISLRPSPLYTTSMGTNKRCSEKARAFFPHCAFPDGSPRIISHPNTQCTLPPGLYRRAARTESGAKIGGCEVVVVYLRTILI